MNINRTARIASIIEKRRPLAQKIEGAEALCLGAKPMTLQDFADHPLPSLPNDLRSFAEFGAMHEHLSGYHANLEKYRHLLREPSPRRIGRDEIRKYVAQDNLVVRHSHFDGYKR